MQLELCVLYFSVDTSPEMIRMAKAISKHEVEAGKAFSRHIQGLSMLVSGGLRALQAAFSEDTIPCLGTCRASYRVLNAESTSYPSNMFDLVTIM